MGEVSDEDEDRPEGLRTARLILRAPRGADAEAAGRLIGTTKPGGPLVPLSEETLDARAFIARARLGGAGGAFSIVEAEGGTLVGSVGAAPMAGHPERTEVAAWIGESFSGRGFGTEATQAMIDRLFLATPVDVLWAVCRVTNRRGRRLAERCGFQYRENGMARSVALRGAVAVERFALERRTWAALKAWSAAAGFRQHQAQAGCCAA